MENSTTYAVFIVGNLNSADGPAMGTTITFSFDTTASTATTSPISWAGAVAAAGATGQITLTWSSAQESSTNISANYDVYLSTGSELEDLMFPPYTTIATPTGGTVT